MRSACFLFPKPNPFEPLAGSQTTPGAGTLTIDIRVAAGTAKGHDVEEYPEIAGRLGINDLRLRFFATRSLPCCPEPVKIFDAPTGNNMAKGAI